MQKPQAVCDGVTNICIDQLEYNGYEKHGCFEVAHQEADFAYYMNFTLSAFPATTIPIHYIRNL